MTKIELRAIMLTTFASLQLISTLTYADIDNKCTQNCRQMGYSWTLCDEKCTYNNSLNNNPLLPLNTGPDSGAVGGMMQGLAEGQRQALINEQIENERLKNKLLKQQLEIQRTPEHLHIKQNILEVAREQYNQKNYFEAARLYNISAKNGNQNAQFILGQMYTKGLGVQQSDLDAAYWFKKSAEQGNSNALASLAFLYYSGKGVNKNDAEATRLSRIAADMGNTTAQFNMGLTYERGIGVKVDFEEALMWYRKAAAQGHQKAIQKSSELGSKAK
jgi:hypothetical protein